MSRGYGLILDLILWLKYVVTVQCFPNRRFDLVAVAGRKASMLHKTQKGEKAKRLEV